VSEDLDERPSEELELVVSHRKREARQAGMSVVEARLFAESEIDIGELRRLVKQKCPSELLARVLL
jgi:hypothetical protein